MGLVGGIPVGGVATDAVVADALVDGGNEGEGGAPKDGDNEGEADALVGGDNEVAADVLVGGDNEDAAESVADILDLTLRGTSFPVMGRIISRGFNVSVCSSAQLDTAAASDFMRARCCAAL